MSSGGSALHAGLAPSRACACDQTGVPRSGSPPTPGRALVEKSQNTHTLSPRAGTVGREAVFSLSHPLPTLFTSCRSVRCLHSQACPATAWPALSPAVWADRVTAAGLQHPEGRWGVRAAHGSLTPGASSGGDSAVRDRALSPPLGPPCHSADESGLPSCFSRSCCFL